MKLQVTEIKHYTESLFRIRTERPSSFRFTAGEFTMVGMEGTPKRAYSLTSGPYDDYLEFYSIKVPDGPLTSRLRDIRVGDYLEVSEKTTGTLTLANLELGGNLWLLATGTGIAPFISILRDPTTYDHFDSIHVYWSVREAQDLDSYHSFLEQQPINYTATVTQDPTWRGHNKRITTFIRAGEIVPNLEPSEHKVMICGSIEFNQEVAHMFDGWGFSQGTNKRAGNFVQERAFVS